MIPLTPYLAWLFSSLPRVKVGKESSLLVFVSTMSKSGRIAEPRAPHADVLADAGIPHVSIHGLRRTFALLGEAAGAPAGAIAQVMGTDRAQLPRASNPAPLTRCVRTWSEWRRSFLTRPELNSTLPKPRRADFE